MKSLTIGSATIDTIAIIASDRIERMSMLNADASFLLLQEGSKTEAIEISTHCGGGAVNTAVALARLGFDAAAIVKLGQDQRAETILARLMDEGVSPRWALRDARAPTGASVLVSSHDRNAAIFTFRGANTLIEPRDLKDDAFAVDLVHVASLSNASADCFPLIIEKARAHGALVSVNPGPRQLAARGPAFQQCLGAIDVLSINRAEAEVLVPTLVARFGEGGPTLHGDGLPRLAAKGLHGGGFHMSLSRFMSAVVSLGPRVLLVTDGGGGAYAATANEIVHASPVLVDVAGTAGAGDAFVSTFAGFTTLGRPLDVALKAAALNAASVVGHVDTQTGLLTEADMASRLAGIGERIAVRRWQMSPAPAPA
ncbi:MAG: carbohydrate kinase family protein [Hyphomicrobiaceae bacterium]|nr:carbohydrate kinase family protein [Hyphomicrobiaceae bacterium]